MYNFDIATPTTVADAVQALKQEEAQPLSGGQTLIPTLKQRLAMPSVLVSLKNIDEMKGIEKGDGTLRIGGGTCHADVHAATKEGFAGLHYLTGKIGDMAVRNRGTIGGSVANNDPAACYPSACLACDATIHTDNRDIAADDFFQGMFTTALNEGEIVTGVTFKMPQASSYQKFEQPASRFPLVGVFVAKHDGGVRVGVTGASNNGVFRWTEAEEALSSNFSAEAIDGLSVDGSEFISDLHGSPEYRAHLVKVLTQRGVRDAT